MSCEKSPVFDNRSVGYQILNAFSVGHFDEDACRRTLLGALRAAPVCPGCGRSLTHNEIERMLGDREIRCECGRKSMPRSGTVLDGVHADYRMMLMIAVMHSWGVHQREIAERAGVSVDTVRRLIERLKAFSA